jgi:hypothetical protein
MKKLQGMEKKRAEKEKEKSDLYENEKKKRLEKLKRAQLHKEEINEDNEEYRQLVLAEQKEILTRGANKDNMTNLKRVNAGEKIVREQLTIENNMKAFRKRMNLIQSASILKKSPEERFAMYKEKKRQEDEKKKKELEDKMAK